MKFLLGNLEQSGVSEQASHHSLDKEASGCNYRSLKSLECAGAGTNGRAQLRRLGESTQTLCHFKQAFTSTKENV
jgi:hypothetical protein